jgi:hypothetical protein
MQTQKTQKWFSTREVATRYGVHHRSIERWVKTGKFPAGVQFPNTKYYWSIDAIEAHERALVAGRVVPISVDGVAISA